MKADVSDYYEYVLLYTSNTLVISKSGKYVLREQIRKNFKLKEESIVLLRYTST